MLSIRTKLLSSEWKSSKSCLKISPSSYSIFEMINVRVRNMFEK
ncbi:15139_t:CDS:1, partial [Funneliformis caledonium]